MCVRVCVRVASARAWPYSQQPVDGDDEADVLGGQPDCRQHEQHGDEAGTRHARRADTREGGRQAASERHLQGAGGNIINRV